LKFFWIFNHASLFELPLRFNSSGTSISVKSRLAAATQGGLGARLDWNNLNFWAADFAVIHLGADSVAACLDIKN
jgi:hypothetical protein